MKLRSDKSILSLCEDSVIRKELESKGKAMEIHRIIRRTPPIVQGTLFKTGIFFRNLRNRFIVIDTLRRTLIRFGSRENYPMKPKETIQLSDISKAIEVTKKKSFLQSDFTYIQIYYGNGSKILLASKSKTKTAAWIHHLNTSIQYSKEYDLAMRERLLQGTDEPLPEPSIGERIDLDKKKAREENVPREIDRNLLSQNLVKERKFKHVINLSSFDVVKFLGRGAFGKVYKVITSIYHFSACKRKLGDPMQ